MTALYTTKDGQIQMATNTEDLFGISPDELTNKSWDIILSSPYKEHNTAHPKYLEKQFQSQPNSDSFEVTQEGQRKTGDQDPFPVRINISKLTPGDEESMVQILIDEYKETSVALSLDQNGAIKSCGKQIEEFFGYEPDTVKGETLEHLFPQDAQPKGQKPLLDPTVAGGATNTIIRNVIGQHKKGDKFFCTLELRPVRVGEIVLYHGSITRLDTSIEALVILDDSENILSYSQTFFCSLFGYKRGELQGKTMASIIKRRRPPGQTRTTRKRKQKEGDGTASPRHKSRRSKGENGEAVAVDPAACPSTPTSSATATNAETPTTPSTAQPTTEAPVTPSHTVAETPTTPVTPAPKPENPPPSNGHADPEYTKDDSGLVHILHKDGSEVPIHLEVFPYKTAEGRWRFSMKIKRMPLPQEVKKAFQKVVGSYQLGEVLGEGNGGKVKRAIHSKEKTQVAIKIIQKRKLDADQIERTKREIAIMKKLDHENIIKMFGEIETPKKLYIVMELIDGDGDLMKYISTHGKIPEQETWQLFKQVLSAVNYCHNAGIIHRDLKHNNIMINKEGKIKLIDFGTSNFLSDGKLAETFCGTPRYAAPEMMLGQKYDGTLIDTWSLGVIFYMMLTAKFPFEAVADLLVGTYESPTGVSEECLEFLARMLVVKPEERSHIPELMSHRWITKQAQ